MADQLPNIVTPVNPDELGRALVGAWRNLFGETPSRESILLLLAQSAHETARWVALRCYNIGNVKSVLDDGRDFTFFRCWEMLNGKRVWFDPPHPFCRFRAFRTLEAGAVDHLAFLHGMKRYALAWEQVRRGDPVAFVHAIKAAGYFTDNEESYTRSVKNLFAEFALLPFQVAEPELIDAETRRETMAVVALNLRDIALRETERAPRDDEEPIS